MNKAVKTILIASGIAAAVAATMATASYGVTKKLIGVALERDAAPKIPQVGKTRQKLRGFEDVEEFVEAVRLGEEALIARDLEEVSITTEDELTLVGHWYPCENAKRIVLAMHGWRSSWARDFGTIADEWHEDGCHILFVEQRGQGQSGGDHMGFGMMERHDCLAWVRYITQTYGEDLPIYLAGVSMGAATVMMASDLDMPSCVHGVIADCGFTSAHEIWKHVVENNFHVHYGLFSRIADDMCKKKIRMGSRDVAATDSLKNTHLPVLFIHGTDDHFVPVTMTYENYKACASEKRLLIVPGADHGMSHYTAPKEYRQAVQSFWATFDDVLSVTQAIEE